MMKTKMTAIFMIGMFVMSSLASCEETDVKAPDLENEINGVHKVGEDDFPLNMKDGKPDPLRAVEDESGRGGKRGGSDENDGGKEP